MNPHKRNLILISKLKETHLKKLVKFRNNKVIWKLTGGGGVKRKVRISDEKKWFKKISKKKNRLNLAINLNEKYVGNIYFTHMTKLTAQFHIFIGENSLWNKGIGTKSTLLSINFLKVNYNLKKIYLKVKINNTAAIKVYKKCGFKIKKKIKDDNYYMTKNLI